MHSMTGYGRGSSLRGGREVTIELKTVNHRYLDLNLRLPKTFMFLEDEIRKSIAAYVGRGHMELFIKYDNRTENRVEVTLNKSLAMQYQDAFLKLQETLGVRQDFNIQQLMQLPGVMETKEAIEDEEEVRTVVLEALQKALLELNDMRALEGQKLWEDITMRLDLIKTEVDSIEKANPAMVEQYRTRLSERMTELLKENRPDEGRLEGEVVLFAERCAITEEIVRLKSHIIHFIGAKEEGRKLDFIVQEMVREINTVGSKSQDNEIAQRVIKVKSELEKIREQVQNLQ